MHSAPILGLEEISQLETLLQTQQSPHQLSEWVDGWNENGKNIMEKPLGREMNMKWTKGITEGVMYTQVILAICNSPTPNPTESVSNLELNGRRI